MENPLPPHISISQVKTYLRCPKQYEFSYVQKIKSKPSFALDFGSAVHKGIEHNYKQKLVSGKDCDVNEMVTVYVDEIAERKKVARDTYTKKELKDSGYDTDSRDDEPLGIGLLKQYHREVAPTVKPIHVEQPFELKFIEPELRPFYGIIDLIDDEKKVRDAKTSASKFTQDEVDLDIQLTGYAYAYKQITGENAAGLQNDVLVKSKTPQIQMISTTRNDEEMGTFVDMLKSVDRDIQRNYTEGYFRPTPNKMNCGWCGYRNICPIFKNKLNPPKPWMNPATTSKASNQKNADVATADTTFTTYPTKQWPLHASGAESF